ncbi:hypothetical protein B0H14DRAFT_2638083 [Mycena olivaceomarginata]|nr:hypothetical protein B0H14DRAFT_2638083 [Mycena olivaceomarginata]
MDETGISLSDGPLFQDPVKCLDVKIHEEGGMNTQMAVQLFTKLAVEPGFTGSLKCSIVIEQQEVVITLRELQVELVHVYLGDDIEVDGGAVETDTRMELDPGAVEANTVEVARDV